MNITFILSKNFGVTPFEIMAQDIDEVIMVINYFVGIGHEHNTSQNSEKEESDAFWACL